MYDGKGETAKTVNVAEWKSDTILEFLGDKLDDAPAVKVMKQKPCKLRRMSLGGNRLKVLKCDLKGIHYRRVIQFRIIRIV